jgi:two-component system response regulator PilR (NtrC family)
MVRILVVDDVPTSLEALDEAAKGEGREVLKAGGRDEAISLIQANDFDVVVTDLQLIEGDSTTGLEVLHEAIMKDPCTQVIVITSHDDPESSTETMALGAYDYIVRGTVGVDVKAMLRIKITRAMKYRDLLRTKNTTGAQHE